MAAIRNDDLPRGSARLGCNQPWMVVTFQD